MKGTTAVLVGLLALLPPGGAARGQAPTGRIAGSVLGAGSGAPLEGASVVVVGTRFGALAGADGRYLLPGLAPGAYTLRASSLGYGAREQQVTVVAGQTVQAQFTLPTEAVQLDQVVVVGYGTQRKRDLTGSVATVASSEIANVPVARVDQAIAGRVPGVQIQTTNSQPGASMRLRVRGGNSLNGTNDPLVVVDGVIGADLDQLNPEDIASVDVLKDASAEAIYGARSSNGVILITTRRGQPGKIRFEYSGYTGVQGVTKQLPVLSAPDFARLLMRNPNHDPSIALDTLNVGAGTNWQNVIFRTAPVQSHELRLGGTTGNTNLMVSASLFQQQGVVLNSGFTRGSLRFNLDQDVSERFRFGTRVMYSRTQEKDVRVNDGYGSAGGALTQTVLHFAPVLPVHDSAGGYSHALLPNETIDNPLAIVNLKKDDGTADYLLGNLFAEYRPLEGLALRSSLGYTNNDYLHQRYTSQLLFASLGQGQANVDNSAYTTWLSENTLTFRRMLRQVHEITLLGGFTVQQTDRNASGEQGIGFPSDLLGYNRVNLATTVTGSSSASRDRLLSYLGRVNYSYRGRYLLTGTLRTDGSSKFAVNNKWATFPSAAFAWRISDEPFFHDRFPSVTELKLRTSAGRTGSEAISDYQSLASWSSGSPYGIGTTLYNNGVTPGRNPNPNLRWETTTQYDAGLDVALFDNQLALTLDAYQKRTSDLLYSKLVPYFTGYASYVTNIGSVQNRGLEASLNLRRTLGAFDVQLGGNVSLNRNKVLDLGGDQQLFLAGANGSLPRIRDGAVVQVGQPTGNYWGWVWDGIFQDSASAAASGQAGARVGGMKLKDINGDGIVDDNDKTILGNAQPKYIFGQTGQVSFRALSLSWVVRGVQGFQVVNLGALGLSTPGSDQNQLATTRDYWTPTNHTNTMTALGVGPYDGMTSRWVEDGSFVRLQNVTLGWQLPPRLTSRFSASSARLYVSGQNLFTSTRYTGYDPEVSSRGTGDLQLGWDDGSYPGVRTVTLGLNVAF